MSAGMFLCLCSAQLSLLLSSELQFSLKREDPGFMWPPPPSWIICTEASILAAPGEYECNNIFPLTWYHLKNSICVQSEHTVRAVSMVIIDDTYLFLLLFWFSNLLQVYRHCFFQIKVSPGIVSLIHTHIYKSHRTQVLSSSEHVSAAWEETVQATQQLTSLRCMIAILSIYIYCAIVFPSTSVCNYDCLLSYEHCSDTFTAQH